VRAEVLSAGTSRRGDNAFRVQTVLCVYAGRDRLMLTSARIPSVLAVETKIAKLAVKRL
jgi:hypothetical protein